MTGASKEKYPFTKIIIHHADFTLMLKLTCSVVLLSLSLLNSDLRATESPVTNQSGALANSPQEIELQRLEVIRLHKAVADYADELKRLDLLKGESLLRALPTFSFHDATLDQLATKYHSALMDELVLLRSGLKQEDPKIREVRASEEGCAHELEDWIKVVMHSLSIRMDITRTALTGARITLFKSSQ